MEKYTSGDKATKIIRRQSQLESIRSTFEQQWQEIVEQIGTSPNNFNDNINVPGVKTTQKVFDSTAAQAATKFVAALSSTLTPRSQLWHTLSPTNPNLDEIKEVQVYCDRIRTLLFAVRYDEEANFESQINECYDSLGKYGTACLFVDDNPGKGIVYKSIPLSQTYVAENSSGKIDTVYRKFRYTAYAAYDAWGDAVSDKIKTALETSPDTEFYFIHAVYPNEDYQDNKRDSFKFYSCYVEVESKQIISEGGYRTMPYSVSRYYTEPNETYGRSPAMIVLPDIKTLNRLSKSNTKNTEKLADPVLLANDDAIINGFNLQPGAINYGAVTADGRPMVIPLQTGSQIQVGIEREEQLRQAINEAFLVTLFMALVETKNMTATEVQYRAQEKGQQLAPVMGRQQSELLGPMIERELDILSQYDLLPPMPEVLQQLGAEIQIKYTAPLNSLMRASEAIGITNALQAAAGLAQFDPTALQIFDIPGCLREIADINGVPAKLVKSPEEVEAMKQAQAQEAQLQQILQAAPVVAQTSKDFAQAQQAATAAGPASSLGVA